MRMKRSSEGQAMIEFLIGLVAIIILMLGINQIASIVYNDFTTIYSAREEVADGLMSYAAGTSSGSDLYEFGSLGEDFSLAINPQNALSDQLDSYPAERENQFAFVWDNSNPLQDLTGSEKGSTIPVSSSFFQRMIGRSSITINNAVYMPPWEDLLISNSGGTGD